MAARKSITQTKQGSSASGGLRRYTLTLPWPPKELHPNSRPHYMAKARATKQYRELVGWEAKAQNIPALTAPVTAQCVFCVKTMRLRDLDNLLASMKAAWDGLVDAGVLPGDHAEVLRHGPPLCATSHGQSPFVEIELEESP